jgi:L-alanine-DL-glutamate epimerase-like enolase superfamily enzyme
MGAAAVVPGLQAGALTTGVQAPAAAPINKNSAPSDLKITDMRACTVASNYDYPIIRIDTNQGIYGLGEVRDAGVKGIALILKAHILGKNPLEIESILRDIRQFAGQGRMGGGYSAVDMALHDIAGKVYGVAAWRLLGTRIPRSMASGCSSARRWDSHSSRWTSTPAWSRTGRARFTRTARPPTKA